MAVTIRMVVPYLRPWYRIVVGATILGLLMVYTITEYKMERNSTVFSIMNHFTTLPLWEQTLDFDQLKISNETGNPSGCYVVPNYIHFVRFGGRPIRYVDLICILAAFKNQQPEKIFFHFDKATAFNGKYWNVLEQTPGFMDVVVFNRVEVPSEIFGQPLSKKWGRWHASDIVRIQMLMKYGGIYLDFDSYIVRGVNTFRKFECTIGWDGNDFMGNMVMMAHKDARFLKKYLESYRKYVGVSWYYNGGIRPRQKILYKEPHLVHRVKNLFAIIDDYIYYVFQRKHDDWKEFYLIHLLERHQYYLKNISEKATYPVRFNETNIAYYPITFRDMAYDVYDTANITWPKDKLDE